MAGAREGGGGGASEHAGGEHRHSASGGRGVRTLGQRRRSVLGPGAAAARTHHVRVRAVPLYLSNANDYTVSNYKKLTMHKNTYI